MERENNRAGQKTSVKRMPESRKYRRNFIDVLVLVLVILSIVSFFLRGRIESMMNQMMADDMATVNFVITDLAPEIAVLVGQQTEFSCGGAGFGTLQSYEDREGSRTILSSSPFEFIRVFDPSVRTVTGTFTVIGNRKDSGFYLACGEKIAVGKSLEISAKGQKFTILITKIS